MTDYIITGTAMERWNIPAVVTAGEIVRCRDCAYILYRKYNNGFEYQTCSYFDSEHAEVEPDGFCKWAERKH